jgi:uncharacterized protein YqhQ
MNLLDIQKQLYYQLGFKVDVYHSEEHRGILAVKHNQPLTPFNVIFSMNY